jgi:hypothetical protein
MDEKILIERDAMEKVIADAFMADYNIGCDPCPGTVAEALYLEGYRKQSGWVSVDERLPEADVRCLVWAKNVLWRIKFAWYYEPTKKWYVNIAGDIKDEVKDGVMITHWMPIPEPPEMKGGE